MATFRQDGSNYKKQDELRLDTEEVKKWIEEFQEALLPPTPDDVRERRTNGD